MAIHFGNKQQDGYPLLKQMKNGNSLRKKKTRPESVFENRRKKTRHSLRKKRNHGWNPCSKQTKNTDICSGKEKTRPEYTFETNESRTLADEKYGYSLWKKKTRQRYAFESRGKKPEIDSGKEKKEMGTGNKKIKKLGYQKPHG